MATKHKIELITTFSSDISGLNQGLDKVQAKLKNLDLGDSMNSQLSKLVTNLSKELGSFEQRISRGLSTKSDVTGLERSLQKIQGYYTQLQNQINKLDNKALAKLLPDSTLKNIETATKAFAKLKEEQKKIASSSNAAKKALESATKAQANLTQRMAKKTRDSSSLLGDMLSKKSIKQAFTDVVDEIDKQKQVVDAAIADARAKKEGAVALTEKGRISAKSKESDGYKAQLRLNELNKQRQVLSELSSLEDDLAAATKRVTEAQNATGSLTSPEIQQAYADLKKTLVELSGDQSYASLELTAENIERVGQAVANLSENEAKKLGRGLPISELQEMNTVLEQTEDKVHGAATSFAEMTDRVSDVENLKRSLASFFSVTGAIELVKRSAREAYAAVKELDAAMTETAVVTDFTVSDMWDQLPRYTETANELGVTTLGAYETMTLFYQQGLKTNEVFEIGTETMKMARIGGLDYADATDKMTAALRGFNMELNATSAQRISDVYSELAAITAADTEEISTAMTKTASIANSANMEFETTAAFLSQIIETTRESAETAGTAMKTVIARFQELKKDPSQIGEIEGEIVDANKIETALRSVGVALRDSSGQFRELDEVFLELSSKWDSLDTNTQRYIATIAAGSRQQSRFIAMMSDYDRTMQLVNAAYDSNGAAQRQYEKTLDSLESKLARLKNAWDEFVLGITNSDLIKTGVDTLTTILQIINKLTKGAGGLSTTFLRLGAAFGGIKLGKVLITSLERSFKNGESLGTGFAKEFTKGFKAEFNMTGTKKIKEALGNFRAILPDTKFVAGEFDLANLLASEDLSKGADALERLGEISKASVTQLVTYQSAREAGIPIEQASLLLTQQNTAATLKQIVANANLSEEEKKSLLLKIQTANAEKQGLLSKLGSYVATKLNISADKNATKTIWNKVAAKVAEKTATDAANASALVGLGIAAAAIVGVVALTAAIVWLAKRAKDNTLEKRMERAAEATDKAKEAANNAQQAYNELNDSLKSLEEGEKALETLTKGTDAWRAKVNELNAEVTSLIEKYPELKQFMVFDSDSGRILLTKEGQAAAKSAAAQELQDSQLAYLQASAYENRLAEEQKQAQIRAGVVWYDEGGNVHDDTRAITEKEANILAEAFAGRSDLLTGFDSAEELIAHYNNLGIELDGVGQDLLSEIATNEDTRKATIELINTMNANSNSINVLTKAYNDSLLQQSKDYQNSDYQEFFDDLLVGMVKDGATNPMAQQYQEELAKLGEGADLVVGLEERFGEQYKELEVAFNDAKDQFTFSYKDENGDPQSFTWDEQTARQQLATENVIKSLNYGVIESEIKGQLDTIVTRLTGEGTGVTEDEAKVVAAAAVQAQLASGTNDVSAVDYQGLTEAALMVLAVLPEYKDAASNAIQARRATAYQNSQAYDTTLSTEDKAKTIEAAGITENAFDAYVADIAKELQKVNSELEDTEEMAERIADETIREKTGLDKVNEILEENKEALKDANSIGYNNALDQLASTMSTMLKDDVSVEFLKASDNLELVKSAAAGSSEALIQLKERLAEIKFEELAKDAEDATGDLNLLRQLMGDMNGYRLEVVANFDESKYIKALNNLLTQTSISAEELTKIMGQLGWDAQFTKIPIFEYDYRGIPIRQIDTKKIFTGVKKKGNLNTYKPSTTKSSSGSSKKEDHDNSFDKYYNKVEDLNEELRTRNKLEVEYNDLVKDSSASIIDVSKNLKAQLDSLERQRELQEFLMDARRQQIRDTMQEYSSLAEYAWYNFDDNTVEINWDKIDKVKNSDKGAKIEDYIGKLEDFQDQQDEAQDALDEINDTIEEINERGKDQYLELEDRILDAVVAQYQEEIDALSNINDSINTANNQMMAAIQNTLAKQRQDEDNAETEQELSDMQRRLDYLRQDTSGANALEIKKLEEQLASAQDDYTDALIDQKLSEIEEQNQQAADQRERQIAFAEAQLEAAQKAGTLWEEVHNLLLGAISPDGSFIEGSVLEEVLRSGENWTSLSEQQRKDWAEELITNINEGISWLIRLQGGDETKFAKAVKDKLGVDSGTTSSPSTESSTKPEINTAPATPSLETGSEVTIKAGSKWYSNSYGGGQYGSSSKEKMVKITHTNLRGSYPYHVATLSGSPLGWLRKKDIVGYKTGGLADFTGPAWLDGTRARPELILNQRDTQNFIQLKDVLADAMKHGFSNSENTEEVVVDIDINIEKVESKEDVDMLLDEIERRITSNARYRNVNSLRLTR